MEEINFQEISQRIQKLAIPKFDLVVGVASGGIVPGSMIASSSGSDFKIIRIHYRNDSNEPIYPEPVILKEISISKNVKSILIVDDVSVSGKTLNTVKNFLKQYDLKSLVLKGKADYVVFPELKQCVLWPWTIR